MPDDTPPWAGQAAALLAIADDLQEQGRYEDSLPSIAASLALLDEFDPAKQFFALRIDALSLRVNAICRRGTQADLAACEAWMAEAFALAAGLQGDADADRYLLAKLWGRSATLHFYYRTVERLQTSLASIEQAISIQAASDQTVPKTADRLALYWGNKAISLSNLGDAASLRDSQVAYDKAIALRAALDLDNPKYRDKLATCWRDKGLLLLQIGDAASLRASLAAYDKAIELRAALDLDNPGYRNNLATCWRGKGFLLRQMGDAGSLRDSLASYDKAIELRAPLDLDNPEYRDNLATCWSEKGFLLRQMGDAGSLRDSLASYDKAIELRAPLDLDNPTYRDNLAICWSEKGFLLRQMGDAASLRDSLAAYEKAIELREPLDLDNPAYGDNLAICWSEKGFLLQQMGDAASLQDGLAAYEEAIELRATLDLNNAEFRDHLALCWSEKGFLLRQMGDAASLRDGLAAYEEAIALRATLDLNNSEFRDRLASCWSEFGSLLSLLGNSTSDFERAVLAFKRANELLMPLLSFPGAFYLESARSFSYLAFNHVTLKLRLQDAEAACDLCDQALAIVRNLEQLGFRDQRQNREILFGLALRAYRAAGAFGAIDEVILDHLDPRSPGSAADSAAMHQAANETLKIVFEFAAAHIGGPDYAKFSALLNKTLRTQNDLAAIRVKNFAGSATLARLNAEAERLRGRAAEAQRILDRQIEYRSTDPEGFFIRGEFLLHQGQRAAAEQDFLTAGRLAIRAGARDAVANAPHLAQLAAMLLRLKLQDLAASPAILSVQNRAGLTAAFDDLLTWLERKLPESWIAALDEPDREPWRRELSEKLRDQWREAASLRAQFFEKQDQEVRQAAARQLAEQIERGRGALASFPQLWRDFVDDILTAFATATRAAGTQLEESRPDFVLETLEIALQRASARLSAADLAAERAEIGKILPLDSLEEPELRNLACTLRCRRDPVMAKFAAIELGCAVEWSVVNRFLAPLRTAHLQHGHKLPPPAERDAYPGKPVFKYLTGGEPKFFLGNLVGTIGKISERLGHCADDDFFAALAGWLTSQPNGRALLSATKENWRHRRATLSQLESHRNDVAHGRETDIGELWHNLVGDPDDAFFRYFPAIFSTHQAS